MGCYKRTKSGFDFTKRVFSLVNNTVGGPFLRGVNSLNHVFLNQNLTNPFGAKRFDCDSRSQDKETTPHQTKPYLTNRGLRHEYDVSNQNNIRSQDKELLQHKWKPYWKPYCSWETVPFTKRKHFVLSPYIEMELFEPTIPDFEWKLLPQTQHESVRVRLVAKNIVESLHELLKKEQVSNDPIYEGTLNKLLESKTWEVVVVDDCSMTAGCNGGGNIFVHTDLLKHFRSDAEIAFIIGHEVAHIVARHIVELRTVFPSLILLWICITQLVMNHFSIPLYMNLIMSLIMSLGSPCFVMLHFQRKMELEADYIGMLLMASAGYDPRVAPRVIETLHSMEINQPPWYYYFSSHPCGKKRAHILTQPKVMEEALLIYKESRAGKDDQRFL